MSGSVLLNISEIHGDSLLPMDRNGSSDPYIKIVQCDEVLHKTKPIKNTLNPRWSEIHTRIDSQDDKIILKVNINNAIKSHFGSVRNSRSHLVRSCSGLFKVVLGLVQVFL